MGEVYRARDPRLGRDVAIRVLPAAFNADPERLRRFEQEARAAATLNHPNILAVHDIGTHDGAPYIVSELLDGETLRARLSKGPGRSTDTPGSGSHATAAPAGSSGLSVRKALDYAVQIVRGLAAAHEKGIVHRDLKPDNVFTTTDGHVKILDFGLAKLTEIQPPLAGVSQLATTPPGTQPGLLLGTMGYMAPEQVRGQAVEHRADIFAFGAILYEMLSGQRAFAGATSADTLTAILEKDAPELPTTERHIPSGLTRIVDRCLEKNPAARFQSTHDLGFALEAIDTQSAASPGPARAGTGAVRERAWMLVAATSLVVAIVAVAMWLSSRHGGVEPIVTRLDVVTPPTTEPLSFALSPDGRQLVFVANGEKGPQLWLRALDQVTAQPLASTDGATYPFWSPDSRAIGFLADDKLKRLNLSGGTPQTLTEAPAGRGGTWNRDGVIVFSPATTNGLQRVSATGGQPAEVTRLAGGHVSHRWPHFLPDGRHFLFTSALGPHETIGVYIGSLDGGEPTRIPAVEVEAAYVAPGYLLWVSQDVLVARRFDPASGTMSGEPVQVAQSFPENTSRRGGFSVSDSGVLAHRTGTANLRQLVWVDRAGKAQGVVGSPDDAALAIVELAPDGRHVAVYKLFKGLKR